MIEVTNLTKRYGNHLAVDRLSFHVEKGQIYGFLGPNGAGKSTTMNMLTGYLAATEGSIVIGGHDMLKEPEEAKKCIGYLPELPPLYTEMTVAEYLSFAAELKRVPKEERAKQLEEVMKLTQITDMAGRLIKNLSKGYRQRVGLAQAILGYPEVIILDEPTVGLDPKQIIEIRDLIRKLGEEHTVILSSHILSEVSAICDHIMIIAHGQLVASDSPEGLQKLIRGTSQLELTVKGEAGQVNDALAGIEDIEKSENLECREEGCVRISLTVAEKKDVREQIFYRLADRKLPIMEMQSLHKSLEDIFLELTGEEQAAKEGPAVETQNTKRLMKGLHKKKRNKEEGQEKTEETAEDGDAKEDENNEGNL